VARADILSFGKDSVLVDKMSKKDAPNRLVGKSREQGFQR
jgi:hypothetical protein